MPGQLLHHDPVTGDTLWFLNVPGTPNEPGWFGAPGGEISIGSPVVYVPGYRDPVYSTFDYSMMDNVAKRERALTDPIGPRLPGGQFYSSRRLGAPVAASPSRTAIQAPPAAFERVGGRPSSAHGFRSGKARTARGKCPKGHYWSYKLNRCVRSKY